MKLNIIMQQCSAMENNKPIKILLKLLDNNLYVVLHVKNVLEHVR